MHTRTRTRTHTHAHTKPPPVPPFPQVTLDGHTGAQAHFMGVYELSAVKANGAPRFVRRLAGGGAQYLFRSSIGAWMVTDDESNIAKNRGQLLSSRASDLPSEAGLGWQYYDKDWPDDPNLTCTEVRGQQQHDRAGGGKGGGKRARRSGRRATQPTRPAASSFVRFRAHHPLLSRHRPSHPSMAPHASEGYDAHTHASHAHDQHED